MKKTYIVTTEAGNQFEIEAGNHAEARQTATFNAKRLGEKVDKVILKKRPYELIITEEIKTASAQTGRTVRKRDGDKFVFYGPTKEHCRKQAKAAGRKGREEWRTED